MENYPTNAVPSRCPVCNTGLVVTHLQCPACNTDITGTFDLGTLATLREPHASLIELFLRTRGNLKEMERTLGLSYPTVRARLEEALLAAGLGRPAEGMPAEDDMRAERARILDALEQGEMPAAEAAARLREFKTRRPT